MFSLICAWITRWVNNGEAGDLRPHRAHYDVNLMIGFFVTKQITGPLNSTLLFYFSCHSNRVSLFPERNHTFHLMISFSGQIVEKCNQHRGPRIEHINCLHFLWDVNPKWCLESTMHGTRAISIHKDHLSRYGDFHYKDEMVTRLSCLVPPCVRDKRRVSEIDLSQPRHETAFSDVTIGQWRHNRSVTSQLTDPIKWRTYPLELIRIYVNINTHNKESLTQRCRRSTNAQLCLIFLYSFIWFES